MFYLGDWVPIIVWNIVLPIALVCVFTLIVRLMVKVFYIAKMVDAIGTDLRNIQLILDEHVVTLREIKRQTRPSVPIYPELESSSEVF